MLNEDDLTLEINGKIYELESPVFWLMVQIGKEKDKIEGELYKLKRKLEDTKCCTLTDRCVVTIDPDEEVVKKWRTEGPLAINKDRKMRPEPTLSLSYVREHACDENYAWEAAFVRQFEGITNVFVKTIIEWLFNGGFSDGRIRTALHWLIEHKIIDESLQIIPGVSK